jgi:iron complex transport system ATP-binding protein
MIPGLHVESGPEAVLVTADRPLHTLSSAVRRGGLAEARVIVNLHVERGEGCEDPDGMLEAYARRRGLATPYVGLLTGAHTQDATFGEESAEGFHALAIATVGLSNRMAAGRAPIARWTPSTINTIVLVEGDPEPAALVNLALTVTEVKVLALIEAGIANADGTLVTGTSTDAVIVAATGQGPRARFGGPVSALGWTVARAARRALDDGIRGWRERNP